MREHLLYIGGAWRPGRRGRAAAAVSPSSGETFASVAVAGPADVDDAVAAAAAPPSPPGRHCPPSSGPACCAAVAAAITGRREELARALTQDQGKPLGPRPATRSTSWPSTSGWPPRTPNACAGGCPPSTSAGPAGADRPGAARRGRRRSARGTGRTRWARSCSRPRWPPATRGLGARADHHRRAARCSPRSSPRRACPAGVFNFVPGPGPVVGDAAGRPPRRGTGWASSGRWPPAPASPPARRARPSCWNWAATGPWWSWRTPTWSSPPTPRWRRPTCAPARAAPPVSGSWCTPPSVAEFVERVVAATKDRGPAR